MSMYGAPGICTEHEARTKHKAKTMKKYLAKLAVVACVALFALNSQSQAASVHLSFGKDKACCVEKHHRVVKHKHQMKHKHQCCKHHQLAHVRRHMKSARKGCCRHGH